MSDIIEPWRPAPGRRVRVRLSGECRSAIGLLGHDDEGDDGMLTQATHDPAEDGQVGTVIDVDAPHPYDAHDPAYYAHRFLVEFDRELTVAATTCPQTCQYYAASELEPGSEEAP